MKMRLLIYLILLPVILLMAFISPALGWLRYVTWTAFGLSIALVIYALIRTKQFYKSKKMLFILLMPLFLISTPTFAFNGWENAPAGVIQSARNPQFDPCANAEADLKALREERLKISRIPLGNRTPQQQHDLETSEKKIAKLMTDCQIQQCPTVSDLYEEAINDCWICDVAYLFIEAGDKVTTLFFKHVSEHGYALALLAVGFAFWLLIRALTLVGSFAATDVGKFITDVFIKGLFVGGAAILLRVPLRDTADFFISPFFIFSSIVNEQLVEISDAAVSGTSFVKIDELMYKKFGKKVECGYCEDLGNASENETIRVIDSVLRYNPKSSERAITPVLRNSILCSVCSIYRVTTPPVVSGQFLFCSAKQLKKSGADIGKAEVYSDLDAVIVGGVLSWVFLGITAIFSFYLIDSFIRICFVFVLFPFLIVAFVFQSTRQYTKKGLDVLIHSMVTYIVVTIFMVLLVQIFYTMLGPVSGQIVEALANETDAYTELHKILPILGGGGLVLLCCIAIVFLTFFMLQIMHGCIAEISGVDLTNGGGIAAARSTLGKVVAATRFVQEMYRHNSWTNTRRTQRDENGDLVNGTDKRGEQLEKYGRQAGHFFDDAGEATENAINRPVDSAANAVDTAGQNLQNSVDRAGTNASRSLWNAGLRMCGQGYGLGAIIGVPTMILAGAVYVGTKIAAGAIWLARKTTKAIMQGAVRIISKPVKTIVRSPGILAKKIAHNKYFNKTVGFFWSMGYDAYDGGYVDAKKKWRKVQAWLRYRRRRRGP